MQLGKAWATRERMGDGGLQLGTWLLRAGSGAGLEAAVVRGVVTRSHWQRWGWPWPCGASGQPVLKIKVVVKTVATVLQASLAGLTTGYSSVSPSTALPAPGFAHRSLQVREDGVSSTES